MKKFFKMLSLASIIAFVLAPMAAFAQDGADVAAAASSISLSALTAIGAGLVIIGAALGIGRIGGSAVESMARQPEVAGQISTAMIVSAALIEGATFFALVVCLLNK